MFSHPLSYQLFFEFANTLALAILGRVLRPACFVTDQCRVHLKPRTPMNFGGPGACFGLAFGA